MVRRIALLAALLVPLVAAPAAAATAEEVAEALRRDPVYVADDARRSISAAQADDLRDRIRESGRAIFVAVVGSSLGDAGTALGDVRAATALSGTYAVVTDDGFRAESDDVPTASAIASAVFQRERARGPAAVLEAFVDEVTGATASPSGGEAGGAGGVSQGERAEPAAPSALPLLLVGGAAVGGVLLMRRRRTNRTTRETAREFEADRQLLRAELAVLADDVLRLEPEVRLHEAARTDYEAAVARYRAAEAALDYADDVVDLVRVERVVREAQYAMARARAVLEGREPPAPPVELQRRGRHDEPPLDLDEAGQPVYVGYPGPFYGGGWFGGGGGGLLTGLLLGGMFGGFGGLGGWGHHGDIHIDGDGGGGDGGGWGGGDWGGDVGGGDW